MDYRRIGNTIAMRIDKGESVLESIKKLSDIENINTAFISGIGATSKMDIGCYKFDEKVYVPYSYEGEFEITSLIGNITQKEGEFYLHLHINACDEKGKTYAGHLNDAIIGVTCELHIQILELEIERQLDESTGINIFKFMN